MKIKIQVVERIIQDMLILSLSLWGIVLGSVILFAWKSLHGDLELVFIAWLVYTCLGAMIYSLVKIISGIVKAIRYKFLPYSFQGVKYIWYIFCLFLLYFSITMNNDEPGAELLITLDILVLILAVTGILRFSDIKKRKDLLYITGIGEALLLIIGAMLLYLQATISPQSTVSRSSIFYRDVSMSVFIFLLVLVVLYITQSLVQKVGNKLRGNSSLCHSRPPKAEESSLQSNNSGSPLSRG